MKRVSGVVLLFASVVIFWLSSNDALARDIAVSMAGFVAAIVIAAAVAAGFCFLPQCAPPRTTAAQLLRLSPENMDRTHFDATARRRSTSAGPANTRKNQ